MPLLLSSLLALQDKEPQPASFPTPSTNPEGLPELCGVWLDSTSAQQSRPSFGSFYTPVQPHWSPGTAL